jgi:hypothetical protein
LEDVTSDSTRARGMMFIPVVILLGVWMVQVTLTQTHDLTPWKGGGFGMFSVTTQRNLAITAVDADGVPLAIDPVSVQARHYRLHRRALAMPTVDTLCHVAEVLTNGTLYRVPLEQSPMFGANQAAWWRLERRIEGSAPVTLTPRDAPIAVLGGAARGSSDARPIVQPQEITVAVHRVAVDVDAARVTTEAMPTAVRWSKGRCEVSP